MMHEPRETLGSLPHFSRSAASRRWVLGRWSEGEDSGRKETDDGRLPRPLNVNPGRVQGICPMNYGLQCGAVGRGIKKTGTRGRVPEKGRVKKKGSCAHKTRESW